MRVDARLNGVERLRRCLVRLPVDLVVVALRIVINDSNAGAGCEIVKLVEELFLPRLGQCIAGIGVSIEPGD
jgi:hypothetical protein